METSFSYQNFEFISHISDFFPHSLSQFFISHNYEIKNVLLQACRKLFSSVEVSSKQNCYTDLEPHDGLGSLYPQWNNKTKK